MTTRAVVAGIDGSARSLAAADWAAREAVLRGLPLRLVHAAPALPPQTEGSWSLAGDRILERTAELLGRRHTGLRIVEDRVRGGAAQALTAHPASVELLVIAARGAGGFPGLLLGSTAWEVAGQAPVPVALVPSGRDVSAPAVGDAHAGTGEIVLGIDARAAVDEVTAFAFDTAERSGAALRALHAWSLPPEAANWLPFRVPTDRGAWEDHETHVLHDVLQSWRDKFPHLTVRPDVRALTPASALVAASARAGRLVVGRTGTGLTDVTDAVLHHARCPVVVVPHG